MSTDPNSVFDVDVEVYKRPGNLGLWIMTPYGYHPRLIGGEYVAVRLNLGIQGAEPCGGSIEQTDLMFLIKQECFVFSLGSGKTFCGFMILSDPKDPAKTRIGIFCKHCRTIYYVAHSENKLI